MPTVQADQKRCKGWAICVAEADDVFDIDDDGVVVLLQDSISAADRARVEEVARRCPESALSVSET
jgi:ferredoxin